MWGWERPDDIVIKREDLYTEVWSTPMAQLAKKYNISDVGLAKICRKMEIPRPPRGYWAKAQHGAKVKPEPLKPLSSKGQAKAVLNRATLQRRELDRNPAILETVAFEKNPENRIEVADKLRKPHSLIVETKRQFKMAKVIGGRLELTPTCLDVRVSKRGLPRAMLVMDAILKAAEQRGYTTGVEMRHGKNATYVAIDEDRVHFHLEEIIKSVPHVETQAEKKERQRLESPVRYIDRISERLDFYATVPRADYKPQGILSLHLDHYSYNTQRSWADGKQQRVESCLNKFFIVLQKSIDYERDSRLTRERNEQARRDAAERQRIFEERLKAEKAKVKHLKTEMEGWEDSHRIRAYIAAMQAAYPNRGEDMEERLTWASQYADHLDPTNEFKIEVLEEV